MIAPPTSLCLGEKDGGGERGMMIHRDLGLGRSSSSSVPSERRIREPVSPDTCFAEMGGDEGCFSTGGLSV